MAKYTATERNRRYYASQGYCVYMATYPEGVYIGSGRTIARRDKHMAGSTRVAKSLGSKAISFEVLVKGTKEYCETTEGVLILNIGIPNLLNKQRANCQGQY